MVSFFKNDLSNYLMIYLLITEDFKNILIFLSLVFQVSNFYLKGVTGKVR